MENKIFPLTSTWWPAPALSKSESGVRPKASFRPPIALQGRIYLLASSSSPERRNSREKSAKITQNQEQVLRSLIDSRNWRKFLKVSSALPEKKKEKGRVLNHVSFPCCVFSVFLFSTFYFFLSSALGCLFAPPRYRKCPMREKRLTSVESFSRVSVFASSFCFGLEGFRKETL